VLTALDKDEIRTVSDLLGSNAQYSAVRDRLISAYAVPQATRFRTIIQHGGMGDRHPSQMLRDMRSVLPEGIGDAALKEFWMQKLPPSILTVISGLDGPLDTLAERADRVMDASAGREICHFLVQYTRTSIPNDGKCNYHVNHTNSRPSKQGLLLLPQPFRDRGKKLPQSV